MPKIPSVIALPAAHATRPYPKPPTVLALAQTEFSEETFSVLPLALTDARNTVVDRSRPHPYLKAMQRRTMFASHKAQDREEAPSNLEGTQNNEGSRMIEGGENASAPSSLPTVPPVPRLVVAPSEVTTIKIPYPGKSSGRDHLKAQLHLGQQTDEICQYIQKLAKDHLDLSVSYDQQTQEALDTVRDEATTKYPQLLNYVDVWPIKDLLILDCKAGVQRAKTRETRAKANQRGASERPTGRPASRRQAPVG